MTVLTVGVHLAPDARRIAIERDVRSGLLRRPKSLPPVWFYDERGSELFDQITRLPEYYLTRAERSVLARRATEITAAAGADTLVELGSGTSDKTRLLLDAMARSGRLRRFVPFDVSEETLVAAAADIADTYRVDVTAVVGDFHQHLGEIPADGRRLIAFLGSTIGNLNPEERHGFLTELATTMSEDDRLLLGTDLVKDVDRLLAAYDDAAGVTAEFNRNVLLVVNHELGADFEPLAFDHVVRWDADEARVEMRLRSQRDQRVHIGDLGVDVDFDLGEDLLTEISSKFTPDRVSAELVAAGFERVGSWTDPAGDFQLTLAAPKCSARSGSRNSGLSVK